MRLMSYIALCSAFQNAMTARKPQHDPDSRPRPVFPAFANMSSPIPWFHAYRDKPLHCIRSWAIYDSSAVTAVESRTETILESSQDLDTVTLGYADIYTEIDGFDVASGSFIPTAVITTPFEKTETITTVLQITTGAWPNVTPRCPSVQFSDRSRICDSYLSSAGFRREGSTLVSPSAWFDSVACPVPYTTCSTGTTGTGDCFLRATDAVLYHFPDLHLTADNLPCGVSVEALYSFAPGLTLTSPEVVMSIGQLTTLSQPTPTNSPCSICNYGSCEPIIGSEINPVTPSQTGPSMMMELPASSLSTMIVNPDLQSDGTALKILADFSSGAEGYFSLNGNDSNESLLITQPFEIANLSELGPIQYYLNPLGAPGCASWYRQDGQDPSPECGIIFKDLYVPYFVVPRYYLGLAGSDRSCEEYAGVAAKPVVITEFTVSLTTVLHCVGAAAAPSTKSSMNCIWQPQTPGVPRKCKPVKPKPPKRRWDDEAELPMLGLAESITMEHKRTLTTTFTVTAADTACLPQRTDAGG